MSICCGAVAEAYTGMTNDVAAADGHACSGRGAKYTRAHPPEALAALWRCGDKITASRLEYAIKAKLTHGQKETLAARAGEDRGVVPRASRRGGNRRCRRGRNFQFLQIKRKRRYRE